MGMDILSIVLWAMVAVMAIQLFRVTKRQNKTKKIFDVVDSIHDKDLFFQKADALIEEMKDDPEILTKAQVLKLWGCAYHDELDEFSKLLTEIDMHHLVHEQNGIVSIDDNEDSFFYLCLSIPNTLYNKEENDLRHTLRAKVLDFKEMPADELIMEIAQACEDFYDQQGDLGKATFEKIMDGDYGDEKYARSMISLYKGIVAAMLGRIYIDQDEKEKFEDLKTLVQSFSETGIGSRWVNGLHLAPYLDQEEETDNQETEDDQEEEDNKE